MAKQTNKKKEEIKLDTHISDNTNTITVNNDEKNEEIKLDIDTLKLDIDILKNVNIADLISYEKACALICKRYESAARIEYKDYKDKFNKYKMYYEKIFSEIENRVNEFCK